MQKMWESGRKEKNTMERYENVDMEIIYFTDMDVITESNCNTETTEYCISVE